MNSKLSACSLTPSWGQETEGKAWSPVTHVHCIIVEAVTLVDTAITAEAIRKYFESCIIVHEIE